MHGPLYVPGLALDRPWMYTSVASLRTEGLSAREVDDDRARSLIQRLSQVVTQTTRQWFAPVRGTALLDGDGTPAVRMPTGCIIDVEALRLIDRGFDSFVDGGFLIDADEYTWDRNWLRLVTLMFKPASAFGVADSSRVTGNIRQTRGVGNFFPEIPQCVMVTGTFGWLEEIRYQNPNESTQRAGFATELAGAFDSSAATSFTVDSASLIRVGDVVLVGDAGDSAFVTAVSGSTVTIEAIFLSGTYAVDTAIRVYGRVPREIEHAVQLLVYYHRKRPFESLQTEFAPAASPELPIHGAGPETFNPNPSTSGGSLISTATGVPRVDQILDRYTSSVGVAII